MLRVAFRWEWKCQETKNRDKILKNASITVMRRHKYRLERHEVAEQKSECLETKTESVVQMGMGVAGDEKQRRKDT